MENILNSSYFFIEMVFFFWVIQRNILWRIFYEIKFIKHLLYDSFKCFTKFRSYKVLRYFET